MVEEIVEDRLFRFVFKLFDDGGGGAAAADADDDELLLILLCSSLIRLRSKSLPLGVNEPPATPPACLGWFGLRFSERG